jgi:hypothetical protein
LEAYFAGKAIRQVPGAFTVIHAETRAQNSIWKRSPMHASPSSSAITLPCSLNWCEKSVDMRNALCSGGKFESNINFSLCSSGLV